MKHLIFIPLIIFIIILSLFTIINTGITAYISATILSAIIGVTPTLLSWHYKKKELEEITSIQLKHIENEIKILWKYASKQDKIGERNLTPDLKIHLEILEELNFRTEDLVVDSKYDFNTYHNKEMLKNLKILMLERLKFWEIKTNKTNNKVIKEKVSKLKEIIKTFDPNDYINPIIKYINR